MNLIGAHPRVIPRRARGALGRAFRATSASECAHELVGVAERFGPLGEVIPCALRGEWSSVVFLARMWQALIDDVLQLASGELPELVQRADASTAVRAASGEFSVQPSHYLDCVVVDLPFSPFVAAFGPTLGIGVHAINAVRSVLPGCSTYALDPSPAWRDLPRGTDIQRYRRLVELALRGMQPPLVRVKELFGLNNSEVADMFGVSRQAVDQWEIAGDVSALRRPKLANLLSVGELLDRKLAPGRLPLIARRPAAAYGGMTMVEMVADGRDAELVELTGGALDWSATL
jgi:transcriptional regulator with XRE-family HTH domain